MPRRLWTQTRIAELKRLWRAGATATAIGNALGGVTRSAVLGKVFRLRLVTAGRGARVSNPDETPVRRRAGKPAPKPVLTEAQRKTLLDLTNECCRWPYGELGDRHFFFCGAAGADIARGIPYCPRHMQRAYIVPPSLVRSNVVEPLQKLLAGKSTDGANSTPRSFPRTRESS